MVELCALIATLFKLRLNKKAARKLLFVIRPGLEPGTYCLEGSCSIQLS